MQVFSVLRLADFFVALNMNKQIPIPHGQGNTLDWVNGRGQVEKHCDKN